LHIAMQELFCRIFERQQVNMTLPYKILPMPGQQAGFRKVTVEFFSS
jgi:hypothetical protein